MKQPQAVARAARPLPDLCAEVFAFALSLRSAKDPGDAESLRRSVAQLFDRLSQRAREANIDSAHLDQARYVLCALIDEIVLSSKWEMKSQWMNQPLQMAYFQDFTAGEQFYRRLDALTARSICSKSTRSASPSASAASMQISPACRRSPTCSTSSTATSAPRAASKGAACRHRSPPKPCFPNA
jgi:hypothetical protein